MASPKTKVTVGLFVICGVVIGIVAIVWLGVSQHFQRGRYYVSYFNESVQGLSKDSPVKYRGVAIGRVDSIKVAPDSKLIEMVMKIESGQTLDNTIVAQLKTVGITGIMFVELDRKKKGERDFSPGVDFPSEYPIVATKPSDMTVLLKGIDDVLTKIGSLDLSGISDKLKLTLDNVNGAMADADIKGISTDLRSALHGFKTILQPERWEKILASVEGAAVSLNRLTDKAERSISSVDRSLTGVEGIVAENRKMLKSNVGKLGTVLDNANLLLKDGSLLLKRSDDSISELTRQLSASAWNIEKATDNMARLMETLADQPSQLLLGTPPAPRKVAPEIKE
ncbi:MAG TPA: MCE family protein [Deltaproteobacteria bacterium]|nr:MCE family protein [Deltaproteobacteria bacterium]HIJ36874.1 MCE family protein [Deltaproteobacteria bacterium]HIJ40179.1 MCE family protein [Deltaproteobacteria bacterium]